MLPPKSVNRYTIAVAVVVTISIVITIAIIVGKEHVLQIGPLFLRFLLPRRDEAGVIAYSVIAVRFIANSIVLGCFATVPVGRLGHSRVFGDPVAVTVIL